jgi:hypothetical protein
LSAKLVPTFVDRGVSRGHRDGSPMAVISDFSRPEPLLVLPRSSSVVLTRQSEPRSIPTTSQKIWMGRESNPDLWPLDHRGGPINTIPVETLQTFQYRTWCKNPPRAEGALHNVQQDAVTACGRKRTSRGKTRQRW